MKMGDGSVPPPANPSNGSSTLMRSCGTPPSSIDCQLVQLRGLAPPVEHLHRQFLVPRAKILADLRDRVRAVEAEGAAERQRTGRQVSSRRAVLAQSLPMRRHVTI